MRKKTKPSRPHRAKPARLRPVGSPLPSTFFYRSADFAAAADAYVSTYGPSSDAYMTMFLLCRALELALKAALRADGVSSEKLRTRSFGHNLGALIRESTRRGLMLIDPAVPDTAWGLERLSEAYGSKELEYQDWGTFSGPTPHLLRKLVQFALDRASVTALRSDVRQRLTNRNPPLAGFTLRAIGHYK